MDFGRDRRYALQAFQLYPDFSLALVHRPLMIPSYTQLALPFFAGALE